MIVEHYILPKIREIFGCFFCKIVKKTVKQAQFRIQTTVGDIIHYDIHLLLLYEE